MSSLYLDRKNLAVKLDGQALALYEEGIKKGTVPLHLLDRIVMRGNVQLESRLLGTAKQFSIILQLKSI